MMYVNSIIFKWLCCFAWVVGEWAGDKLECCVQRQIPGSLVTALTILNRVKATIDESMAYRG